MDSNSFESAIKSDLAILSTLKMGRNPNRRTIKQMHWRQLQAAVGHEGHVRQFEIRGEKDE